MSAAERRARRLARLYPASWRSRFGDEFEELLVDDIRERPRCAVRTLDVVAHASLARLVAAGLVGRDDEPRRQAASALNGLGIVAATFVVVGVGMWSQLTIDWQWSPPAASGTRVGMLVMSTALLGLGAVAVLAVAPILWAVARAAGRSRLAGARLALVVGAVAAVAFWLGCAHFGPGWPGTGGRPWPGRDLVPASVARIAWAGTLWVSAYWAHPGALGSFPPTEIVWMAVSPALLATTATSALAVIRRIALPAALLRWLAILGGAGSALMAVFAAGAACWVVSGGPGPRALFRIGLIDDVGLIVLVVALVIACQAARRAICATTRPRTG